MESLEDMRQAALEYSLSRAPIFAGLPQEDLQRLAGYVRIETVGRGAELFRQGDPVRGFFVMRLGLMHAHRTMADGREQIIHILRPGASFAERAMMAPGGYPATARAVEDCEVILVPAEEFRSHQRERPDLAWCMVASMSHHLRALVSTIEGLRFTDMETRFLHWLLQRCPSPESESPVEIPLDTTKGELAGELAARQETLSRAFRKLGQAGLIAVKSRSIVVHSPAELQKKLRFASCGKVGGFA